MRSPAIVGLSALVIVLLGVIAFQVVESSLDSDPEPAPAASSAGPLIGGGGDGSSPPAANGESSAPAANGESSAPAANGESSAPAANGESSAPSGAGSTPIDPNLFGYVEVMCREAGEFRDFILQNVTGAGGRSDPLGAVNSGIRRTDEYIAFPSALERPARLDSNHRTYIENIRTIRDALNAALSGVDLFSSIDFSRSLYPAVPDDLRLQILAAMTAIPQSSGLSFLEPENLRDGTASSGGSVAPAPQTGATDATTGGSSGPSPVSPAGDYGEYVEDMCRDGTLFGGGVVNALGQIGRLQTLGRAVDPIAEMEEPFLEYLSDMDRMVPPPAVASAHASYLSRIEARLASMRNGTVRPQDAADDFERDYPPLPAEQVRLLLSHPSRSLLCDESRFFHQ